MPRFSILLPVIRPPAMLPFAIESVLAQTLADFELLVVCDGAPDATVDCARRFAERDARVKCFPFPKGERHGEAYRHAALEQAAGEYAAHISDDDLWFPSHLEELETLLTTVDFGVTQQVDVYLSGHIDAKRVDLANPALRARIATSPKANRFGPTFTGYRMSAYRRLPEGWHPGPLEIGSDAYMWQKFLSRDDITAGTRAVMTALHFSSPMRAAMSMDERTNEVRSWFERIQTPQGRAEIVELTWRSLVQQSVVDENLILSLDASEAAAGFSGIANPEAKSPASKLAQIAAAHERALSETRDVAARADAALSESRDALARANAELDTARAEAREASARADAALSESRDALARANAELDTARAEAREASARADAALSGSRDALARANAELDTARAEAREASARADAALSGSRDALARANAELDTARAEAREASARADAAGAALSEANLTLARIVNSKSWRWTEPFRRAMSVWA